MKELTLLYKMFGNISPFKDAFEDIIVRDIIAAASKVVNTHLSAEKLAEYVDVYYKNDNISDKVVRDPFIQKHIIELQTMLQKYERGFEKNFTEQFLKDGVEKADSYINKQRGLIEREGRMADLKPGSKVIVLGSGSLPVTTIVLSTVFDAYITCLDLDPLAIAVSKELIRKKDFKIKLL